MKIWVASITVLVCLSGLLIAGKKIQNGQKKLTITSSAFNAGQAIPAKYTCDCPAAQNCAEGYSPPLTITNITREAKSLALICDDPDAVGGMVWQHWVWWNLPVSGESVSLPEHADMARLGAREGANSDLNTKYAGPCPPPGTGTHHYRFTVYALDTAVLNLDPGATGEALIAAMKDHIVAQAVLVGTYASQANA